MRAFLHWRYSPGKLVNIIDEDYRLLSHLVVQVGETLGATPNLASEGIGYFVSAGFGVVSG